MFSLWDIQGALPSAVFLHDVQDLQMIDQSADLYMNSHSCITKLRRGWKPLHLLAREAYKPCGNTDSSHKHLIVRAAESKCHPYNAEQPKPSGVDDKPVVPQLLTQRSVLWPRAKQTEAPVLLPLLGIISRGKTKPQRNKQKQNKKTEPRTRCANLNPAMTTNQLCICMNF